MRCGTAESGPGENNGREQPPTPGVLPKSSDLLDCEGLDVFGDDKEFATISKDET
jgi:hypothetical protein